MTIENTKFFSIVDMFNEEDLIEIEASSKEY